MAKRIKTKFAGVYQRETEKLFKGKPDITFDICFKHGGTNGEKSKLLWEKVGRLSEGYSAEMANVVRGERLRSIRHSEELPREKAKAPLFKDAMKDYLEWCDGNKMNGRREAACHYNTHLRFMDNLRLDEIHPLALERLKQNTIVGKGLSPATAKFGLTVISGCYNKAIVNGYRGENPVRKVKKPFLQNQRVRFLSHYEATLLLDALKKRSLLIHDILLLSLYTGLRVGEIFKLRYCDVDFKTEQIHVADPKNKHPRQTYITPPVLAMLRTRIPEPPSPEEAPSPAELIFKGTNGSKIPSILAYVFTKALDELGFNKGVTDNRQKVVAHTFRHTFASWLALQGTPIQVIGELLGHRTLAMTMRYAHLTADHKAKAVEAMQRGFEASKAKLAVVNGGEVAR